MKYQIYHETIKNYQPDVEKISIENIPSLEDHTIEDINIYNILELVPQPEQTLSLLLPKLRLKGSATIVGIDLNKICELYIDKIITYKEFNDLTRNKIIYPLSEITNIIRSAGFKINLISTDRLLYHIECGRINKNVEN